MRIASESALFLSVNQHLKNIDTDLLKASRALERYRQSPDDQPLRNMLVEGSMARSVHNAYGGFEKIFEEVAERIDGGKPTGDQSDAKLLMQMRAETSRRPALITDETSALFEDLRQFRNKFRSSYGADLRHEAVIEKLESVQAWLFPRFLKALQDLAEKLEHGPDATQEGRPACTPR
ncbi:hypothetical protein [Salipiger mucosus]|uniref:ribonuclease toxin HepT-like protein n=1 Tax=Salipiger mucosus TaxID=263378 RepID=UPI00037644DD|nr:hypothetical protein [Salipiger mucosus]